MNMLLLNVSYVHCDLKGWRVEKGDHKTQPEKRRPKERSFTEVAWDINRLQATEGFE